MLARITAPLRGTCSSPVTVGRQTALATGGTTVCTARYIMAPIVAPTGPRRAGSAPRTAPRTGAAAQSAEASRRASPAARRRRDGHAARRSTARAARARRRARAAATQATGATSDASSPRRTHSSASRRSTAQPRGAVRRQQRGHVGGQQGRGGQQHGRPRAGRRPRTPHQPTTRTQHDLPDRRLRARRPTPAPARRAPPGRAWPDAGRPRRPRGAAAAPRAARATTADGCHCAHAAHRARTRGCWARRASRCRTSSTVPGPRHGTTGQPRAASRSSRLSRSTRRIRQARPARDAGPPELVEVALPEGVDDQHGHAATDQHRGRGDDRRVEHRREDVDDAVALDAEVEGRVLVDADGVSGTTRARVPVSRCRCRVPVPNGTRASPGSEDPQAHPVADPDVVLGERRRGPHREVQAAGAAVDAAAVPEVAQGVHDDEHAGVLLGPGGDHLQRAGAQRDRPVDPAQPVPGGEGPDPAELRAAAHPPRAVRADQAVGLRRLGPGVEGRRLGQHRDGGRRDRPRSPAEARPRRRSARPARRRAAGRPHRVAPMPASGTPSRDEAADDAPTAARATTYGGRSSTRVTCSTPSRRRPRAGRWPAPCPSCSRCTPRSGTRRGAVRGRCTRPSTAGTRKGAVRTTSTGDPRATAPTRPAAATAQARASAGVATQRVTAAPAACSRVCGRGDARRARSRRPGAPRRRSSTARGAP